MSWGKSTANNIKNAETANCNLWLPSLLTNHCIYGSSPFICLAPATLLPSFWRHERLLSRNCLASHRDPEELKYKSLTSSKRNKREEWFPDKECYQSSKWIWDSQPSATPNFWRSFCKSLRPGDDIGVQVVSCFQVKIPVGCIT